MRCGIIEAERLRLNVEFLVGAGDIKLFEVCIAVEDFLVVRDTVVLDPEIGVVEAVRETADVSFPVADDEVKIVRTIPLRKTCGVRGGLSPERAASVAMRMRMRKRSGRCKSLQLFITCILST